MDHDRRHLKAAKALVIVIPLFGFTYILTFIGPDEVSSTFQNFQNLTRSPCSCSESTPWATPYFSHLERYSCQRRASSSLCLTATATVK